MLLHVLYPQPIVAEWLIGIDINESHFAVTETDRFGNPVEYFSATCTTYGKTTEQREAIIGEAVRKVMVFNIIVDQ